jgi:hypothetical protein
MPYVELQRFFSSGFFLPVWYAPGRRFGLTPIVFSHALALG